MEFWKMNLTKMNEDSDVKNTAKCLKTAVKYLFYFRLILNYHVLIE
jgi:hypothetical protein